MNHQATDTLFAPAQRSGSDEIMRVAAHFQVDHFFGTMFDEAPAILMVLNGNRQVVFANKALLNLLNADEKASLYGMRPGELLCCTHSLETEGGCGTTSFCRYCGAVNAILKSQEGKKAIEECRILVKRGNFEEALDLRVWATPFEFQGDRYTLLALADIADEKRRAFVERIFLHDILNTASALRGFSELIAEDDIDEDSKREFIQRVAVLSNRIVDEINAHRQLMAAENNDLKITTKKMDSLIFLSSLINSYSSPEILNGRHLRLADDGQRVSFETDETLLNRIIGNMAKNAIEASLPGGTVTMGCSATDDHVSFWVHNSTYMPEEIRLQIFSRSFSTKGAGRGLGTYSMKYLTEKYLHGSIVFESTEAGGTTFTATYPLFIQNVA